VVSITQCNARHAKCVKKYVLVFFIASMKPNFCKGKQRQRTNSELSHDFVSLLVELARNLNACFLRCHLDFVRGLILKVRMQSKGAVSKF